MYGFLRTKETKSSTLLPQTRRDAVLPFCCLISFVDSFYVARNSFTRELQSTSKETKGLREESVFQAAPCAKFSLPSPPVPQAFEMFLVNNDKFF